MSEDTIFKEVDEELRSERMRALWHRFGPYVIGAAVAVVLVVAVNEGWSWWQKTRSAASADRLLSAVELVTAGDLGGARIAFDGLAANGHAGYPVLARFSAAELLAAEGKTAEAIALFDALATELSDRRLRETALILAANLLVDSGGVAAVEQRVGGLTGPDNPLRGAALQAIGLAQYKSGDLGAAHATFEAIAADPTVGQAVVARVRNFAAQLAAEGAAAPAGDQ